MKKYSTTYEYTKRNTIQAENRLIQRLKSKKKQKEKRFFDNLALLHKIKTSKKKPKKKNTWKPKTQTKYFTKNANSKPTIYAPKDFRLIDNSEVCLTFFKDLRDENYLSYDKNVKSVTLSLENVEQIDYGTISVLTAISDDLHYNNIIVRGDFPKNEECQRFFSDSGILNHMVDGYNRKFPKAEKSEMIFFEKGSGVLLDAENRKISLLVQKVVYHLTGESKYSLAIKTIILEICGNSIEWSGTESKQWLLGVKYDIDKVVFTVTDVGKGILDTLYRKFALKFKDTFTLKSRDEILFGAFEKKYSSTTQEVNRNKGLPAVKASFDTRKINSLKVLTNNVILHFDNNQLSKTFDSGTPRFKGTFYQWEIDNMCLKNINIDK